MRVTEEQDVSARAAGALDHAVGAGTDVVGRLTSGGRMVPDGPAGHRRPDLRRRYALVAPVVPFDEVVVDDRVGESRPAPPCGGRAGAGS